MPAWWREPERREALARAIDLGSKVTCHPGRMQAIERAGGEARGWLRGYQLQRVPHDSQVGGCTSRLWHTTLEVTAEGWSVERVLVWRRVDDGEEMS